ncbi:hypothetical protein HZC20_00150 [Candidatus Peregrinibacteria bacterium]|nr:hypothetical protein [Candidatus Peregrinibacteria bacterium]
MIQEEPQKQEVNPTPKNTGGVLANTVSEQSERTPMIDVNELINRAKSAEKATELMPKPKKTSEKPSKKFNLKPPLENNTDSNTIYKFED